MKVEWRTRRVKNLLQNSVSCDRFSIRAWSTVAAATRRSMWRRCSKRTVCCSISEKSLHCHRGRYDASTRSSSHMRISIISLALIICSVCLWDTRKQYTFTARPALPSACITSFRPIDGIWSKATAPILSSL